MPANELHDAQLEALILRASAVVEDYCARVFAAERVVEALDMTAPVLLVLARAPITTIHELSCDDRVLDPAGYRNDDPDAGIVRLTGQASAGLSPYVNMMLAGEGYGWPSARAWPQRYAIDYTAGYIMPGVAGANLPVELEDACQQLVRSACEQLGSGLAGQRSDVVAERLGDASWSYAARTTTGLFDANALMGMPALIRYRHLVL